MNQTLMMGLPSYKHDVLWWTSHFNHTCCHSKQREGNSDVFLCANRISIASACWLHGSMLPVALAQRIHISRGSQVERATACHSDGVRRTHVRCRVQVQYPMRTGRWLHALALPLALAAVSLLPRYKSGPGRWALCGKGAALWAASTLACIALPACLGAARVAMTGERRRQTDHLHSTKSCLAYSSKALQDLSVVAHFGNHSCPSFSASAQCPCCLQKTLIRMALPECVSCR